MNAGGQDLVDILSVCKAYCYITYNTLTLRETLTVENSVTWVMIFVGVVKVLILDKTNTRKESTCQGLVENIAAQCGKSAAACLCSSGLLRKI
jgi:hypothetical protein